MASNRAQGCLGGLALIAILCVIFPSCQSWLKQFPSFKQPQVSVKDPEFNQFINEGYRLAEQRACKEALGWFQKALKRKQKDTFALKASENMKRCIANQVYSKSMSKGYQHFEREQYKEALVAFSKALEQRPKERFALKAIKAIRYEKPLAFGSKLLQADDYETALVVFETLLKQYPEDVKVKQGIRTVIAKVAVSRFNHKAFSPKVNANSTGKSRFYAIAMFLQTQLMQENAIEDALIVAASVWREHPNDALAKQQVTTILKQVTGSYIQRLKGTK
jgi:tetratricopeptide (TPR) repeat protein